MRILSLTLENIKSYRRATVALTEGMNAVCGLNGSGKTTVLEAIGFVLFDFLPYSQQAFLREGERAGSIRVQLLGRDGREYEVVRRIGGGTAYYVSDAETGMKVVDGAKDVPTWICSQALHMDIPVALGDLFKNAVGVPQGLMTADFHRTTQQRKSVFDSLLRVEEYRDAYETLSQSARHVRDLSGVKREEIAGLQTDTDRLPQLREEAAGLAKQLRRTGAALGELTSDLSEANAQRAALDDLAEQVRDLYLELRTRELEVENLVAQKTQQEVMVESAASARRRAEDAQPGYEKVRLARERLAEMEVQRRERDGLAKLVAELTSDLEGIKVRVSRLQQDLDEAQKAEERAKALVEPVIHQERLDQHLREARLKVRDGHRVEEKIEKTSRRIWDLEASLSQGEERLARARNAQTEVEALGAAEEELQRAGETLAAMEPLRDQLAVIEQNGKRLQAQVPVLEEQVRTRQELLGQVAAKDGAVQEMDSFVSRYEQMRDEQVRVAAAIEYQNVARRDLAKKHCPLLELQCPVVSTDVTVLERFDQRVDVLSERRQGLETEIGEVASKIEGARAAERQTQELLIAAGKFEQSEIRLEEIQAELAEHRGHFKHVSDLLEGEQNLRRSREALKARVEELKSLSELVAQMSLMQEQHSRDSKQLEEARADLKELEIQRQDLELTVKDIERLERELQALGDPKKQQHESLALASRLPEFRASLHAEQRRFDEQSKEIETRRLALAPYADLEEELGEQREIEQGHCEDHDRFLQSLDEAAQLDQRQRGLQEIIRLLRGAQEAFGEGRRQVAETQERYRAEEHDELKERCEELGRRLAATGANHEHLSKGLERVGEELRFLEGRLHKLQACRAELEELGEVEKAVAFIRETIKSAGPVITETLLAQISQVADEIYGEIMDDHVGELQWDKDYEVLLQRGAEQRKFSQLSGGEQMSAALAVRLALLREMSEVDFAFFDEPTQNMDGDRRANLANQIQAIRGFDQLIVISHDDTFEHHTDNLVRLHKVNDETEVEVG